MTDQDGILRDLKHLLLCLGARDFLYILLPYLRTRFKFRIYILLLPKAGPLLFQVHSGPITVILCVTAWLNITELYHGSRC